jgi:hypothetical protein
MIKAVVLNLHEPKLVQQHTPEQHEAALQANAAGRMAIMDASTDLGHVPEPFRFLRSCPMSQPGGELHALLSLKASCQ